MTYFPCIFTVILIKGVLMFIDFDIIHPQVKSDFFDLLSKLKGFRKLTDLQIKLDHNVSLATAANRITIPHVFKPYWRFCENTLNRPINLELNVSPQSVRKSDDSMLETFSEFSCNLKTFNIDYLLKASQIAASELGFLYKHNEISSLHESITSFPGNTSGCFPLYGKKKDENNIQYCLTFVESQIINPILLDLLKHPCTVFHRFRTYLSPDMTENEVKSRPVWGFPFCISVIEGLFFRKLVYNCQEYCSKPGNANCATGKTKFRVSEDIIWPLRRLDNPVLCLDFSKFDSTIPSFMWPLFYAICKSCIIIPSHLNTLFEYLMCYHNFTPYCYRDTTIRFQQRGVPSGSLITSLFDSWTVRTIVNYAYLTYTHGKRLPRQSLSVLGDDAVLSINFVPYEYLIKVFTLFGVKVNVDKTSVVSSSDNIVFIGYVWDKLCRPTQTLDWFVSHLCIPSKFYRNSPIPVDKLQTYRALSLCAGVFRGMDFFEYLIGDQDYVWVDLKNKYESGEHVEIRYIGGKQRELFLTIPLSSILNIGWKAF